LELAGKTLGVIGLGDIGQKVAQIGLGFGMQVIGSNRSQKNLPGLTSVSLSQLLAASDVISVDVPLTDQTRGMIGEAEITQMKERVIIVNTADEKIVDKSAIIAAVKKSKVFGYGVETALLKPLALDDEYFSCPTILAYPHNAFNTVEATRRVKDTWFQNVVKFIAGSPQNVVTAK
jgi:phosphoglycerate dehydrogenase-like enzyme